MDNENSYYDEVQRWAEQRQKQIDHAKESGEELGFFDKVYYGPKNLYTTLQLGSALKDKGGMQELGQFDMNRLNNVYENILKRAAEGRGPRTKEEVNEDLYWKSLKERGY